jgi:putative FmdB family regulatory protein
MPNYEFRCRECRKRFTERLTFEKYDRRKNLKCPKCGSTKVERVIRPAFVKTAKKS